MKNNNSNNQTTTETSSIQRFFWWCAGANALLLKQCSNEWHKFTAIGVFVFLVALLATVSGTFFLTESLGSPLYFAVFGGAFCGVLILSVDRVMLAFFQKGKGEWKRAIPRILLSVFISLVINDPLLLKFFEGEIEARLHDVKSVKLQSVRAGSDKQARKNQIVAEIKPLTDRLAMLLQIKDDTEKEKEKERGGIKSVNTTGKTGEGNVYRIKSQIFESAKNNYDKESPELEIQINAKTEELQKIEDEINKEVGSTDVVESRASGILNRQKALWAILRENPETAITYLPLFFLLLGIETLPITQKLWSRKGKYDFLMDKEMEFAEEEAGILFSHKKERLLRKWDTDEAVAARVANSVIDGTLNLSNSKEQDLANCFHSEIIRRQIGDLYADRIAPARTVSLATPILLEAIGHPHLSAQMSVPVDLEESITLADLSNEVDRFSLEVTNDCERPVKLIQATNSDEEDIDQNFLPLISQLKDDRRLLLFFEPESCPTDSAMR